ncbi:MAG: 50S ribosomal protein L29 [Bdellovibrionales bacterium]|nr:50S ribosomal protein L29 [Bdellovibrionales bacterium]
MAKKKLEAIKNLTTKEMNQKILDSQKSLFESKIKLSTGQLENTASIWKIRKEIARLKTFLTQKSASK